MTLCQCLILLPTDHATRLTSIPPLSPGVPARIVTPILPVPQIPNFFTVHLPGRSSKSIRIEEASSTPSPLDARFWNAIIVKRMVRDTHHDHRNTQSLF